MWESNSPVNIVDKYFNHASRFAFNLLDFSASVGTIEGHINTDLVSLCLWVKGS